MFDDTYKTIKASTEGIYKEKGSKFLAFAIPVTTETEIKGHVEKIKKEGLFIFMHSFFCKNHIAR